MTRQIGLQNRGAARAWWALAALALLASFVVSDARAQSTTPPKPKFATIYRFLGANSSDGQLPLGNLIFDNKGAIYGVTYLGGDAAATINCTNETPEVTKQGPHLTVTGVGCGTVYKLTPPAKTGGKWIEQVLYPFQGIPNDGALPAAGLVATPSQTQLFGTTQYGGNGQDFNSCFSAGCGTVYTLRLGSNGKWTELVIYQFQSQADGAEPLSTLVLDKKHNLFGTTSLGADATPSACNNGGCGTIFELSPGPAGTWIEKILYSFGLVPNDGQNPAAGLTPGHFGALYGTTEFGGHGAVTDGSVFAFIPTGGPAELTYPASFSGFSQGAFPVAGFVADKAGNLYGTTRQGNVANCPAGNGCGLVFELSPPASLNGVWKLTVLYRFKGVDDGAFPEASLIFDKKGALYGTTLQGGSVACASNFGCGTVFKLTPPASGHGSWTETILHIFSGTADGANPEGPLLLDEKTGTLYGTASEGGIAAADCLVNSEAGCGTAFAISFPTVPPKKHHHKKPGKCCNQGLPGDVEGEIEDSE